MLTLAAPLWLFGLVLLPVIRWLHRGGRHRRAVSVSHLSLWRGAAMSPPAAGERRPPDPAWRRRALLTALLLVALAGPQLPGQRRPVTLWVDDSLSMLTREAQGTRLTQGLAQARSLLAQRWAGPAQAQVQVRTLGDPWRHLGSPDDAVVATLLAGAGRSQSLPPPAALLRRDSEHWLVTDGTDAALFEWPGQRGPDRVIQVAGVARNVGLERLSARRNVDDPGQFDVLLEITNGGSAAETRQLALVADGREVARSTHQLAPGTSALVQATMPAAGSVRARLQPGDALAEDDEIVLDLAALRRHRVATDANCPRVLLAAVDTHPALARASRDATDVDAVLDCGSADTGGQLATIHVRADRLPTQPQGPLLWSSVVPESRRIRLESAGIQVSARLQAGPRDTTLLAVGGEPAILGREGAPRRLETSLDFGSMATTRGPEVPLLVNMMFEHLLGNRLLDAIAVVDRGAGSARVVPADRSAAPADARTTSSEPHSPSDWTRPILLAALLVLLWEAVALGRQWLRLSTYAKAGSE